MDLDDNNLNYDEYSSKSEITISEFLLILRDRWLYGYFGTTIFAFFS